MPNQQDHKEHWAKRRDGARAAAPRAQRVRAPGGGRKRDPEIDERILAAARAIYLEQGWAGFNFVAVSKAAGASRDAVYRRHKTPEQLLGAVLSKESAPWRNTPCPGDAERTVENFALGIYDYFAVGDGYLALRVHVEANQFPEAFRTYQEQVLDPGLDDLHRQFVELLADEPVDLDSFDLRALIESVIGAAMLHALLNQSTEADTARTARARDRVRVQVAQILSVMGLRSP